MILIPSDLEQLEDMKRSSRLDLQISIKCCERIVYTTHVGCMLLGALGVCKIGKMGATKGVNIQWLYYSNKFSPKKIFEKKITIIQ